MNAICVDDEINTLNTLVKACKNVSRIESVAEFQDPMEALNYARNADIDLAFLDIDMPVYNGITLAKKLKVINKRINIIFCTAFTEYALDALDQDCSGYLLKPIMEEDIEHQLDVLRFSVNDKSAGDEKLKIRCFGNFEVFHDGIPVNFKHNLTKEMVAYIVDRRGAVCSKDEIMCALWEDDDNHNSYYKELRVDLLSTFDSLGISDLLVIKRGGIGIDVNSVSCDYYDYINGKPYAINSYMGEYMRQYSWAEVTNSFLQNSAD